MARTARVVTDGLPNRRPDFMQRAAAVLGGRQWEADARRGREAVEPYRGSKTEQEHRNRGRRLYSPVLPEKAP